VSDEWKPTGVWDAVLIDILLGTGVDIGSVSAMSGQERLEAVRSAAEDAQLDDRTIEMLHRMGILDNKRP
jgi:hypothetical protein